MRPKEVYPPGMEGMADRIAECMPSGHPFCEIRQLTQLQEAYLPALLWLFDTNRNRGTGRSYLLARVCIELAMRGERVELHDVTQMLTGENGPRIRRRFAELVLRVIDEQYGRELFTYRMAENTLEYCGRRPR